jgi:hypothetical protein
MNGFGGKCNDMQRVGSGVFCAFVGCGFNQPVMTGLKSLVLPLV